MNAIALPHVDEVRSRRTLLRIAVTVAIAATAGALAALVALLVPHLPLAALALAPRVVPL